MAVLIDRDTRLMVQGITGHQGQFHTREMLDFGTKVVAGVTPGKGGSDVHGVPVFDSCEEAMSAARPTASVVFVPAPYAKDAAIEAIEAGVKLLVIITERIPVHDCLDLIPYARAKGVTVIGPNCPGIATAGVAKAGILLTTFSRGARGASSHGAGPSRTRSSTR
jgi:succinyl-CoA synthetase alpha subunit